MQPCQPTASDYSRSYGSYTSKIEFVDNYDDDDDTVKTLWFKNDDGWTDDGHGSAPNIDAGAGSSKSSKDAVGLVGSSKSSKNASGVLNAGKSMSKSKGTSINVGGGG
eukprot:scaffold222_cov225-Alexandrium_tamarense.AAC.2